ncbi:MAG: DUF1573 domain-containing protein [Flavobacteriaceae bacterium]
MKKVLLLISIVAIAFVSCKEDASNKVKAANVKNAEARNAAKVDAPVITFDKTTHDWGVINEGDKVETTFTFKNTGKSPLIITKIKASCGCTVPTGWKKEPIMPGESGKFDVQFSSKGKPNAQRKTVTVTSNTAKGSDVVTIKAQVTPDPEEEKKRAIRKVANEKRRKEAAAKRAVETKTKNLVEIKK